MGTLVKMRRGCLVFTWTGMSKQVAGADDYKEQDRVKKRNSGS